MDNIKDFDSFVNEQENNDNTPPNPDDEIPAQLPKSSVKYTDKSPGKEHCHTCGWYVNENEEVEIGDEKKIKSSAGCHLVQGPIKQEGWCQAWGTLGFAKKVLDKRSQDAAE